MKYLAALVTIVVLLLTNAACAASQAGNIYRGQYSYNFESSVFVPEGTNEHWCVEGNMEKAELPSVVANYPAGHGTAYVVVHGRLSHAGHYCNMGALKYQLRVDEVIKVTNRRGGEYK